MSMRVAAVAMLLVAMIGSQGVAHARTASRAVVAAGRTRATQPTRSTPTVVTSEAGGERSPSGTVAANALREWIQLGINTVLLAISLLALRLAWRSAKSAAESADVATRIYETAQKQYRASVRPHVTASLESFQKRWECQGIVVRNTGRGTAFDVSVSFKWDRHLSRNAPPEGEQGETNLPIRDLSPGDHEPAEYSRSEFVRYKEFWGSITYRDLDHRVYTATRAQSANKWVVTESDPADDFCPEDV